MYLKYNTPGAPLNRVTVRALANMVDRDRALCGRVFVQMRRAYVVMRVAKGEPQSAFAIQFPNRISRDLNVEPRDDRTPGPITIERG
jgi:hypothetical protein